MIIAYKILFWVSLLLILHTYLIYPVLLLIISVFRKPSHLQKADKHIIKNVSILMAAFNEEEIIEEKIQSIFRSDYPLDKIKLLIGSDNSTDKTNEIVTKLTKEFPQINFQAFNTRQGKANIINQLANKTDDEILILTDANVIFDSQTIKELIIPFENNEIGLVDSRMINKGLNKEGISFQEKTYISREVNIKNLEGAIWGTMMGPFGGCFAIRMELFSPVPSTFLVDDFYINMKVLEKGKKAINNINAKVYEDVSNNLNDEFRRKIRIATGNFQNLNEFKHLLFSSMPGLSFCYISHKVLRWITPLFFGLLIITNILLLNIHIFYKYFLSFIIMILIIPIIDFLLRKFKIHIIILRFITHFVTMNLALFIGLVKYIKGVKSNVWQPTKRNQAK